MQVDEPVIRARCPCKAKRSKLMALLPKRASAPAVSLALCRVVRIVEVAPFRLRGEEGCDYRDQRQDREIRGDGDPRPDPGLFGAAIGACRPGDDRGANQ